ncbi:MAG: SNF2-related protein [Pseudonocardia sp.]
MRGGVAVLAIHGLWSRGRGLLLWGEDGDRPARAAGHALRSARPHPFAVPADRLTALHPGRPALATLLLPATPSGPLDSPALVRAEPRRRTRAAPRLLAWSVPVVVVHPSELHDPVDEVRYGESVAYLRGLVDLAADLAARGRVAPRLLEAPGATPRAAWRPVFTGPDAGLPAAAVAAMPPVVRAEQSGPSGMAAPTDSAGQDAEELVRDALDALVDAAVRDRLARAVPAATPAVREKRRRPGSSAPTAIRSWADALSGGDGGFDGDAAELAGLRTALRGWDELGRFDVEPAGGARATFRLVEDEPLSPRLEHGAAPSWDPAEPGDTCPDEPVWRLEFLLRSRTDHSLLVPASRVWDSPETVRRWIDAPQEVLLGELARASVIYPELVDALRTPRPVGRELDSAGAYRFLAEAAARLDQAGFGVLLPSWWGSRARVGLAVSASGTPSEAAVANGGLTREQLGRFDWRLAVGDDVLTEDEIASLVDAKAPLVRLRGRWVAVDPERLRRGLEFLRTAPTGAASAVELLALAAGQPDRPTPLPIVSAQVDGWLADLLTGAAERTLTPVDPPAGLTATLRPYQRRGLSWLSFLADLGLGACLADDMGLGKTVQLLALETRDRAGSPDGTESRDRAGGGDPADRPPPTLLLCPMSLVGNWQREAATFAPGLRVHAHHGAGRCRGAELTTALAAADLVVTTYGTATRDIDELAGHRWHRVVLDEAQVVKNSRSQAAAAVRRLRAGHRVALTGTPMENRLSELWSVMDFLNPGVLGSAEAFRHRYAIPVERYGDVEAAARLRAVTRPYLLRRVKTDPEIIDDLPEKIEIIQDYRLTSEQASLYRTVVDDMLEKIEGADGIARRGNVLAAMAKLKQVCNHPAQLLHDGSPVGRRSGKVIRLEEVLAEILAEGDRALCFTQFTEFADLLVPHLSARFDTRVLYLHGGTSKRRRDEMVEQFHSDDPTAPSIFLLSLKAGGTGLNLTAANHVLHLDRWWNPAVENQATDRAFRIGQRRAVQVRKFVCAGTLEERIDQMITRKRELTDLVVSDGEGWLTELSTGELRELFTLSEEAVGDEG